MFKVGEYVVYKRNVCTIKEFKERKNKEHYVLIPLDDKSLSISVPINYNDIRNPISKKECEKMIEKIPHIDVIKTNDKLLENEYKKLLSTGKLEDLIKIIKTTYIRNKNRVDNHKKIREKGDNYFNKTEILLYNELSISLEKNYNDTKKYIIEQVNELLK